MAPVELEMNVHCLYCVKKIHKALKNLPGVRSVWASPEEGLVVVHGTADPWALQWRIWTKMKRRATIVSDGSEPYYYPGATAAPHYGSASQLPPYYSRPPPPHAHYSQPPPHAHYSRSPPHDYYSHPPRHDYYSPSPPHDFYFRSPPHDYYYSKSTPLPSAARSCRYAARGCGSSSDDHDSYGY